MLNGKKKNFHDRLKEAFESGYTNAAISLSKMAKNKIYFNNFHFGFHQLGSAFSSDQTLLGRDERNILITTEIFGDVTGKSYLFLSDKEFDFLTSGIPESKNPALNLKEEFAKELDNILSASVITRLSNELNVKMYGDIPILVGETTARIEDVILDDFSEQTEQVYINSISFSFDSDPKITPYFIWVIDSEVLNRVETKIAV